MRAASRVAADIDQAESGAKLENGVLTLTLAKRGAPASGAASAVSTEPVRAGSPVAQACARSQRGRTSKAPDRSVTARPACQRIAAASAIIAPLSVHSAGSG